MTVTPAEIEHVRPYAPTIANVCGGEPGAPDTFDPFDFAAVGLRETGMGHGAGYAPKGDPFGLGDLGHGFGLMQIDDRSHADAIREVRGLLSRGRADLALRRMFEIALGILIDARLTLTRPSYSPPLSRELLRRATFDAYNARPEKVKRAVEIGANPDALTTGHDYGAWVVAKADALRLAAPALFSPAGVA